MEKYKLPNVNTEITSSAERILGSHNSCTYANPRKWWQWLFKPISKCQSLTIKEQFKAGIRAFDFRVRYNKPKDRFYLAHGLVEYDLSLTNLLETLNYLSFSEHFTSDLGQTSSPTYLLLTYETSFFSKSPSSLEVKKFQQLCDKLTKSKYHFIVVGGQAKPTWNYLYKFIQSLPPSITLCSSTSPSHPCSFKTWFPLLYAKFNNSNLIRQFTSSSKQILFYDFVGVYPKL